MSLCEQWSSGALAHRCGRACNWDTMKRLHVRTTYSSYSTLVKIYKLVSGFDLLCVGRWLPRRAILSGTGTVTYACTSVVLLGIISPCDGYLLLVYLKATSVHLSSCQTTCDCLPHAMDVCSLFISTPLACICHPARQLVTISPWDGYLLLVYLNPTSAAP